MSIVEDTDTRMPRVGRASAEDQEMLRQVFSTLLDRAASNGGNLAKRDIERVRTEFSPDERHRFERYSDAHNAIIAALRAGASGLPDGLLDHLIDLYAGDAIEDLYPGADDEPAEIWRGIVIEEIGILLRDWVVPDIVAKVGAAHRRLISEREQALRGEDILGDYEIIAAFKAANRQLDEELRAGAEFGKVLCLAVNARVRMTLGQAATREMFIGVREADAILETVVGGQFGNRFRMTVVDPA